MRDGGRQVVERASSGEETRHYDTFYRAQFRPLVRFVVTLGATWEEAEDAAQEAMVSLLLAFGTVTSPRSWCRTAAERFYVKSTVRLRKAPDLALRGGLTLSDFGIVEPGDPLGGEEVLRLLRVLPYQQRRVMAYHYDGYSPEEIADLLDKKASTVRSTLRHATEKLARALLRELAEDRRSAFSVGEVAEILGGDSEVDHPSVRHVKRKLARVLRRRGEERGNGD